MVASQEGKLHDIKLGMVRAKSWYYIQLPADIHITQLSHHNLKFNI